MWINRRWDKVAVLALASCLVAYSAMQPKYRLKDNPPREFLHEAYSVPAAKRDIEEKIARAYWKCAVTRVQWAYGYGHRLPESPPSEFVLSGNELGGEASSALMRSRYWRRLQAVWYLPNAWDKEYGWDLGWVRRAVMSSGDWFEEQWQNLER